MAGPDRADRSERPELDRASQVHPVGVLIAHRFEIQQDLGKVDGEHRAGVLDRVAARHAVLVMLDPAWFDDPDDETRVAERITALVNLGDPALDAVYFAGRDRDRFFYVRRDEPRASSLSWAARLTPRPEQVLRLALEVARILRRFETAGVTHGGIAPETVLVPEDEAGWPRVRIDLPPLDRLVGRCPLFPGALVPAMPAYVAPEQIAGDPVDARTDAYLLGLLMFRLLTGENCFEGDHTYDAFAHHFGTVAPPPSWLVAGVPHALDTVVATLLRKHPDNRYPSMIAVVQELECALGLVQGTVVGAPQRVFPDAYRVRDERARSLVHQLVLAGA